MNIVRDLINRYPLGVYFLLAYLLSWWFAPLSAGLLASHGPAIAAVIALGLTVGRRGIRELWRGWNASACASKTPTSVASKSSLARQKASEIAPPSRPNPSSPPPPQTPPAPCLDHPPGRPRRRPLGECGARRPHFRAPGGQRFPGESGRWSHDSGTPSGLECWGTIGPDRPRDECAGPEADFR